MSAAPQRKSDILSLQYPYFTPGDIRRIAEELDVSEAQLRGVVYTQSVNTNDDGNFSLSVMEKALLEKNFDLLNVRKPEVWDQINQSNKINGEGFIAPSNDH